MLEVGSDGSCSPCIHFVKYMKYTYFEAGKGEVSSAIAGQSLEEANWGTDAAISVGLLARQMVKLQWMVGDPTAKHATDCMYKELKKRT